MHRFMCVCVFFDAASAANPGWQPCILEKHVVFGQHPRESKCHNWFLVAKTNKTRNRSVSPEALWSSLGERARVTETWREVRTISRSYFSGLPPQSPVQSGLWPPRPCAKDVQHCADKWWKSLCCAPVVRQVLQRKLTLITKKAPLVQIVVALCCQEPSAEHRP